MAALTPDQPGYVADVFTRAADRVQAALDGCTPGPWVLDTDADNPTLRAVYSMWPSVAPGTVAVPEDCYPRGDYRPGGDMAWIALLGPQVGPLLVGLLRAHAEEHQHTDLRWAATFGLLSVRYGWLLLLAWRLLGEAPPEGLRLPVALRAAGE